MLKSISKLAVPSKGEYQLAVRLGEVCVNYVNSIFRSCIQDCLLLRLEEPSPKWGLSMGFLRVKNLTNPLVMETAEILHISCWAGDALSGPPPPVWLSCR